eukprot:GHVL01005657.1.p1 GENE.GHVL01005657.1~~GHVL01005657.1.p1  ORF type:complete len:333 (+),score=42.26 GHVL01005657.1:165-1163(+)
MGLSRHVQFVNDKFEKLVRRVVLSGCARRQQVIEALDRGEVQVDGQMIRDDVEIPDSSYVVFQGTEIPPTDYPRLWGFIKPRGVRFSKSDHEKPDNVFAYLNNLAAQGTIHEVPKYFVPIGHMGINTSGLALVTTDPQFAKVLENPNNKILSMYHVKIRGFLPSDDLMSLRKGVSLNQIYYDKIFVEVFKRMYSSAALQLRMVDGPGRDLKDLLHHFKLEVSRIERLSFGPYRKSMIGDPNAFSPLPFHSNFKHLFDPRPIERRIVNAQGTLCNNEGRASLFYKNFEKHSAVLDTFSAVLDTNSAVSDTFSAVSDTNSAVSDTNSAVSDKCW